MSSQTPAMRASTPPMRSAPFFAPLQREFDRLFDQLGSAWDGAGEMALNPRMDVRDTEATLEVTLEMPGVDPKDVKVSVEGGLLTISGEKRSEAERAEKDYRLSERAFGAFSRRLSLPSHADTDKIRATMDKGVLTLIVPKDGAAKAKTVQIQTP